MIWTEQAISQHLDGKFWAVDYEGRITERSVHVDFLPTYKFKTFEDQKKVDYSQLHNARPWTPEEEQRLWNMRSDFMDWTSICKALRRGHASAVMKYRKMCAARQVRPIVTRQRSMYDLLTDEQQAQLQVLVTNGATFKEIMTEMGCSRWAAKRFMLIKGKELGRMRRAA
jgi:hypothetical protein